MNMTDTLKNTYPKVQERDKVSIICLIAPLLLKYILPGGKEELLKIEFLGIVLFLPYLLLLVYLIYGYRTNNNSALKRILGLQFFFAIISWFFGDYGNNHYLAYLENLCSYYLCYYIAIHYRFSKSQLCYMRKIVSIVFLALAAELILVNLGIVSFGYEQADTEAIGNVSRFTTTMGDTNNGGVAFFMFGMLVSYLNKGRRQQIIYILLWVTGCFLTVTKSVCLAVVFVGLVFYVKTLINGKVKLSSKIKLTIASIVLILAMYQIGVFNPIIERVVYQYATEELESGRDELREDVLGKVTGGSYYIGHGSGCVYLIEELSYQKKYITPYRGAPHNSYVLQYAEGGIIGVSLMILFWLVLLIKNRKNDVWLLLAILSMVGVFFNTETVSMVYTENQLILAILVMLLTNPLYEKNFI